MDWKQPVPVNLENDFGGDTAAFLLFLMLYLHARNEAGFASLADGQSVQLDRGQVLFGREKYRRYMLGMSESTAGRRMVQLEKKYKRVTRRVTNKFTVVTILDYDELQRMERQVEQQTTSKRTTTEHIQERKNDKNVKSVNNANVKPGFQRIGDITQNLPKDEAGYE